MPMPSRFHRVEVVAANERREARIVLVAHDATFEAALAHVLEDAGYAVWSVATAREALACIIEFPPEHVILDLDGEDTDGFGFLHEVASAAPEVNVVVCTRDPSMARLDAITRVHLGIDALVQRPCRLDAIVSTVAGLESSASTVVHIPVRGAAAARRLAPAYARENVAV